MKVTKKIGASGIFIIILVTGIYWFNPDQPLDHGMVIATIVPVKIDLMQDDMGIDGRYIPEAQIIAFDQNYQEKEPYLLTEGFYSARSPEISYNTKQLVFTGQKGKDDIWQIYVLDLETLQIKQITECPLSCTDPAWLPDGRIVFSRLNEEEKVGQIHVLYTCSPDGSNKERLTYHPNSAISSSVFQDGRILILSEQRYPMPGLRQMLALRIDGTKSELFYQSEIEEIPVSRGWESTDGYIYFVEKGYKLSRQGKVVSVAQGHPLSSWKNLSIHEKGNFHSLYPQSAEQLLVSYQPAGATSFGLYAFDIKNKKILNSIYLNNDYHVIEPVLIQERKIPMKLPAIVDNTKDKGTLLCHDTNLSMIPVKDNTEKENTTFKVQVFGLDDMLGEVPVEEDGSFYIEIDADKPVRFQTVNAAGEIVRGPSAWIWVRPNEKRSCIGCHEDRELAPENKVPKALYSGMVSLPDGTRSEPIVYSKKYKKK